MILTPLVVGPQQTKKYINFYKKSKRYKILDNGAFEMEEKGVGCNFYDVIEAAKIISANEIVLTDYLYDCEKTIDATYHCLDILRKERMLGKFVLHTVPQGSNEEEWMDCFDTMMSIEEIDVIGLSKLSVPKCFGKSKSHEKEGSVAKSRIKAIKHIVSSGLYKVEKNYLQKKHHKGKQIHLLGGDNWTPYELSILNKYSFIRSIDTSMPVWYGLHCKKIDIIIGKCNDSLGKVNLFIRKKINPESNTSILHNLLVTFKFSKHQMVVDIR